jgi:hypothetical protein
MADDVGHAVWELFERGLAVCHVIHFLSFYVQIVGLLGQEGMRPVKETLRSIRVRWSSGAQFSSCSPTAAFIHSLTPAPR